MALDTLARAMAAHADSKAKTAYQYAVEGGYTGTEEQFTEDMGNLGINADAVNNAVRFDISQSKTDAQKLQAQANLGLDTSYGSLQDQLDNKASIDGNYDTLGAGTADNLTTNLMEQNSYPFNLAPTGGLGKVIEASNRLFLRKVIYGSVVVNQLLNKAKYTIAGIGYGITATDNGDGSITLTGTNTGTQSNITFTTDSTEYIRKDHIYLVLGVNGGSQSTWWLQDTDNNVYITQPTVYKATHADTTVSSAFRIRAKGGFDFDGGSVTIKPQLIDLTQWYGSTETADHIYAMETANAGDGVDFFIGQCPQASGYIPYNTGTLCSSKPSFHKTSGIQQWDGVYESGYINTTTGQNTGSSYNRSKNYIRVFPNTEYRMTVSARVFYYGIDNAYLGFDSLGNNADFTTPVNCYYIRFCGTSTSPDIKDEFVFIHWDSTMDGSPTEDYNEHSYPIDDTIDGHGIFKFKKANNVLTDELYADGDELTPDGTLTVRYGIVDLGTLSWSYGAAAQKFIAKLDGAKTNGTYDVHLFANLICQKYENVANDDAYNGTVDKSIGLPYYNAQANVTIKDTAYNASSLVDGHASWLEGVYLVYELVTPTTSQKDPYTEEQACDNWGTEIFNDSEFDAGNRAVQIPVGNVTDYPANLKDKVEVYPDLPADDGDYILNKNGSSYTFKKLGSAFPTMPTTDGTYSLKATVSSGTATMSWVADT